jgi:hypothetical protein
MEHTHIYMLHVCMCLFVCVYSIYGREFLSSKLGTHFGHNSIDVNSILKIGTVSKTPNSFSI